MTISDSPLYTQPLDMATRKAVPGVILVLSCHKHVGQRVPMMGIVNGEVAGWPVVVVIGNPLIENEYEMRDEKVTVIRCEDSYFHLNKKGALAMKLISELYDVTHGILRCNDDLVFNFEALGNFFKEVEDGALGDYVGHDCGQNLDFSKPTHHDSFSADYYRSRPDDFDNPLFGMQNIDLEKLDAHCEFPTVHSASGVLMYLSKRACSEVVRRMESIQFDQFTGVAGHGFPYILDDVSIGYMMREAGFIFEHRQMYDDHKLVMEPWCLAYHTQVNK